MRLGPFFAYATLYQIRDAGMATEPDYYIVTFDTGGQPYPWRWELRRRSSPLGVRVGRSGYQSQAAAEYAGKRALEDFRGARERRTMETISRSRSAARRHRMSLDGPSVWTGRALQAESSEWQW